MDYITTKGAASKWDISDRMVLYYCNSGRIDGAIKIGNICSFQRMQQSLMINVLGGKIYDK